LWGVLVVAVVVVELLPMRALAVQVAIRQAAVVAAVERLALTTPVTAALAVTDMFVW